MEIGFLDILILASIIQGFLLGGVILFSPFFKSSTNQYLGYTIVIIAISSLNNWFWELEQYPFVIDLLDFSLWQYLFPVTVTLFFIKATKSQLETWYKWLYAPFIVFTCINSLISLETHYQLYNLPLPNKSFLFGLFYQSIPYTSVSFALILIFWSLRMVFFRQHLTTPQSHKWIKSLWVFINTLLLCWATVELLKTTQDISATYMLTIVSLMVYWLIYKGLYQFKLANDQFEIQQIIQQRLEKNSPPIGHKAAENHTQSPHFEKFMELLTLEKIHHNPDLSRDDVANQLGISSGYLSQIINGTTGKKFPELINFHRIQDAKEMILDDEFRNYSLLAIGLEAGFKSKSAFYTTFKKETGQTPGEFKKSIK